MKKQICARLLTVCSIQFTFGSLESIRNAKTSIKIIPSAPARKKRHAGKPAQLCKHRFPVQPCAVYDQCREHRQKADRHQDAHLHKHRPDVPLGDGRDELPSHLHNTREQADYRTRYKQSAVEQVPRLHCGEAEKNTTGSKSTNAIGALKPSGMVSLVMRFLAFLLMASSVMIFLCFLFCPKAAGQARRMVRRACVF